MTVQLFSALPKATNANNTPLSGAVWYFYVSETTTPASVYAGADLATALGTSVTADSEGEFVPIYFDPDVSYRGVLKNSGGTTIYEIDPINNADEQGTLASLSADGGSDLVGFKQSGTGSISRTAQDKLREGVSVEDFGAVGNGVADDTTAFLNALDTGKSVFCEGAGKNYKLTASVAFTVSSQQIYLNGATVTLVGDFSTAGAFSYSGGLHSCGVHDGVIEGASMSAGYAFHIATADRNTIRNIRVHNPYNFLYCEEANVTHVENVWVNNVRGTHGIKWYGETSLRSDILRLVAVNLSCGHNAIGIEWDGNCHTMQTQSVTIVEPTIGLNIVNSSAGTSPALGLFDDLEIDFPESYGVYIEDGEDFYFTPSFYCHGSLNDAGVYVGTGVTTDRVIFTGGKITGHATYGIENRVRVMASNIVAFDNAMADYYEPTEIYLRTPRIEVDGAAYFEFNGTNPLINFDSTDTLEYDRAANRLSMSFAGTAGLEVTSTKVRFADATFYVEKSGSNPLINFDSNDYLAYNRTSNQYALNIGGSAVATFDASNTYIIANGTLKQVQVGATDSAGTGYRTLRVTN